LILSGTAVKPCLLALDIDPDASGYLRRSSPVHTLITHSDFENTGWNDNLRTRLTVTRRRKAAGSPFKSVSLFLSKDPGLQQVLKELEASHHRGEFLGVGVDKYFLDGV